MNVLGPEELHAMFPPMEPSSSVGSMGYSHGTGSDPSDSMAPGVMSARPSKSLRSRTEFILRTVVQGSTLTKYPLSSLPIPMTPVMRSREST